MGQQGRQPVDLQLVQGLASFWILGEFGLRRPFLILPVPLLIAVAPVFVRLHHERLQLAVAAPAIQGLHHVAGLSRKNAQRATTSGQLTTRPGPARALTYAARLLARLLAQRHGCSPSSRRPGLFLHASQAAAAVLCP
jgi:hypothetical protein